MENECENPSYTTLDLSLYLAELVQLSNQMTMFNSAALLSFPVQEIESNNEIMKYMDHAKGTFILFS